MSHLNIIFAGTPAFAAHTLQALINSPHKVIAVLTQPDKPSGRGLKITPSPVKQLALEHDLKIYQPASLKHADEQKIIADLNADVMVVAAYGLILPKAVLDAPRLGCVNIHPSLLPRWRGAAPIQRTLFAGDKETGVTIMQMDAGLDTGDILLTRHYKIKQDDTSASLHDTLSALGASALLDTLTLLASNQITPIKQDNQHATYAEKISKEEAKIDWHESATAIENKVRAFNPWPVAYTTFQGDTWRVWSAHAIDQTTSSQPGEILHADKHGIDVATGDGVLRIVSVQLPGKKIMLITDFYHTNKDILRSGGIFK